MRILPEPKAFQWDKGNIDKNFKKHKVTTQEAEEIFVNDSFITSVDEKHTSRLEKRYFGLGKTKSGRKLFVAFTIRERKIRIITIRDMKRKERRIYEQLEKDS